MWWEPRWWLRVNWRVWRTSTISLLGLSLAESISTMAWRPSISWLSAHSPLIGGIPLLSYVFLFFEKETKPAESEHYEKKSSAGDELNTEKGALAEACRSKILKGGAGKLEHTQGFTWEQFVCALVVPMRTTLRRIFSACLYVSFRSRFENSSLSRGIKVLKIS